MHENRPSFPLDRIVRPDGSLPPGASEYAFPGMHSDVGGGYAPSEQGRGKIEDPPRDASIVKRRIKRMLNATKRFFFTLIVLLITISSTACQGQAAKSTEKSGLAVGGTGIDYLADHLSVQRFNVNGIVGGRAGKGGSTSCCGTLPKKWQPGMTVEIKWNVTNWRDCSGKDYSAIVPVEKYDSPEHLYVNFLPHNKVRVVSTPYYPEKANQPGSEYPIKISIPQKQPWKKYPPRQHCPDSFK